MQAWSLGKRPALDGVRGLAIALVLAVHLVFVWTADPFVGGYIGVDVFFVLSGFLITSLLLDEHALARHISLGRFYARRALRILPALGVMLAGAVIVSQRIAGVRSANPLSHVLTGSGAALGGIYNMTLGYNNVWGTGWGILHLWSLSVELQFYVVWPLMLLVLLRLRPRLIGPVTIVFAAEAWALGIWAGVIKHNFWYAYHATPPNFLGLMLGSFAAWKLHSGWRPRRWSTTSAAAAGLCFIGWVTFSMAGTTNANFVWANPLVALSSVAIVVAVLDSRSPFGRVFSFRPLRALGRVSYSVYLWHFLVLWTVLAVMTQASTGTKVLWFAVVTAAVSLASYRFVELPCMRLGKRVLSKPLQPLFEVAPAAAADHAEAPAGRARIPAASASI